MNEIQGAMEHKQDGSVQLVINYGMMTVAKMTKEQFAQFVRWCNEVSTSDKIETAVYHFPVYKPMIETYERESYVDKKGVTG